MDISLQLFHILILIGFIVIGIIFALIIKKPLVIIPALFISIIVYILSYNGLFAGISFFLATIIFQFIR